jgi:hypothetical protein
MDLKPKHYRTVIHLRVQLKRFGGTRPGNRHRPNGRFALLFQAATLTTWEYFGTPYLQRRFGIIASNSLTLFRRAEVLAWLLSL